MTTNALPSIREPIVDRFGRWTAVWWRWMRLLFNTVKASADDLVSVTATIDAVSGQWSIQVNVNNRVTAAIALDGDEAESVFAVLADKFIVVHPSDNGDEKQVFIVGNVAGAPTVGIDGDLVVDDTILARHIDVDELDAISADFGTVVAGKLQRADGAMKVDLDNKTIVITNGGYRLYADGPNGQVAIYTVPSDTSTDDTPLTDPLDDPSRLEFHSALPMPAIIAIGGDYIHTGSFSVSSASANTFALHTENLLAHGRSGIPMVFGRISVDGGAYVPLCGSVPIQVTDATSGFWRWAHLGADEDNVLLNVTGISGPGGAALGSCTIDWEVYVTNVLLTGSPESAPDPGVLLRITADMFTAGEGTFDSTRRYLRDASGGGSILPLVQGKTIDINAIDGSGDNDSGHALRYSVDGNVRQFTPPGTSQPSSFNATISPVKF